MKQSRIIIEALNPVNKSNIDTIIHTISKMEGVSVVGLDFDDQYKFIFHIDCDDEALLQSVIKQVQSLLMFYGSVILILKEDQ